VIIVLHRPGQGVVVLNFVGDLTWSTNIAGPAGIFDLAWGPIDDSENFLKSNTLHGAMLPVGGSPGPQHITDSMIYNPPAGQDQTILMAIKITTCTTTPPAPNQSTSC